MTENQAANLPADRPTGFPTDGDRLSSDGDPVGALDAAIRAHRAAPSPELAARLVRLRHAAADAYRPPGREPWPPSQVDSFPEAPGAIPEISRSELSGDLMAAAIEHHGSVIVRGLFDADQVTRTRQSVLAATDAQPDDPDQAAAPDYVPQLGLDVFNSALRKRVARDNGVWLADAPTALAEVLDDLEAAGVLAAIRHHFGSRPLISLQKSTLRRNQPEYRYTGWHQDGSFLGASTRALNVWVALTPCGGDRPAPGLELVGGRVPTLLAADGGTGRASIDGFAVHFQAQATGLEVVQPVFEPGDALLFDELMAHRTYLTHEMTRERLALECWFFAASHRPDDYVSLLV